VTVIFIYSFFLFIFFYASMFSNFCVPVLWHISDANRPLSLFQINK